METPVVVTKVTRYCLFKKSEMGGQHHLVRIWSENEFGEPTKHSWIQGHLTKSGFVATTGPSFNDVNPTFAEKLETEYQNWLKNRK